MDKQERRDRRMNLRRRFAHEALQRDLISGEPNYRYFEEDPISGKYRDVTDKYFGKPNHE